MAWRPHPRRTRTSIRSPRAWGTSDRTGFLGQHERMRFQLTWAGFSLVNTNILVHPDEYDVPNRQTGAILIPPDPLPILNARPEAYVAVDEYTYRLQMGGQARYLMDGVTQRVLSPSEGPLQSPSPP